MNAQEIATTEPLRPLRRSEYDRLVDAGVFDGERIELLWGLIVAMSPQGAEHSWVIQVLTDHLVHATEGRAHVRVQLPFAAGEHSEPEPDLAVVPISDEWRRRHPDRAWLVVEVSRTSQRIDRKKTGLYAACNVDEVWIVDLMAEAVEVYTEPVDGQYGRMITVRRGETLAPGVFPDAPIAVDALLP